MTVPSPAYTLRSPVVTDHVNAMSHGNRMPLHPSTHLIVPTELRSGSVTAFPTALIDSGATSEFINQAFVHRNNIPTRRKQFPRYPIAIDGHGMGVIDREVQAKLKMGSHEEDVTLDVANIGKHPVILGAPWLHRHNPEVNWRTRRIAFKDPHCSHNCLEKPADVLGKANGLPDTLPSPPECADLPPIDLESIEGLVEIPVQVTEHDTVIIAATSISARIAAGHQKETKPMEEIVPQELHEFLDVFKEPTTDHALPPHRPYDCRIEFTPGVPLPKPGGLYSGSAEDNMELKKWIDESLAKGYIRPSNSPVASSCFFVGKKDGKKRLVIDYRKINDITVKDQYPIPLTSDLIDRLRGKKWFTKLDLRWGYHLVRIAQGDEWKTAFKTRFGLFEWTVMPFGLCNAPAVFQRFVNHILHDLLDVSVINYLDDTMPATETREENVEITKEVLRRLRDNSLHCRPEKCEFFVNETDFLGLWITPEGVSMDKHKVEAIREWPTPKNVKDIQTFLGFANFYRRFIKDFARTSLPITALLRKESPWNWSKDCQAAFDTLRQLFTSAPVLIHHDPDRPSLLETDASGYAYGAVLSQKNNDGKIHPIAFMSKSMTPAERHYDIYDKEMLAIVRALTYWRQYLEGAKFPIQIITDHKNLEYFKTTQTLNHRQHRWLQDLLRFDFKISYRPGEKSGKPDALSRRPDHRPEEGAEEPSLTLLPPSRFDQISAEEGEEDDEPKATVTDLELLEEIKRALKKDHMAKSVVAFLEAEPEKAPAKIRKEMSDWTLDDGILHYRQRIFVPSNEEIKRKILELYHDSIMAGHGGRAKTLEMVQRGYHWPMMKNYVNRYVDGCDTCQRNKPSHHKPFGLLKPLSVPEGPWQDVSYDLIVKLPVTQAGNDTIMVVVDRLTKEAHFIATKEDGLNASKTAELFIANVWRLHGLPIRTVSDRGAQFNAPFIRALYNGLGIKPTFSTAYHPETDGQTERTNQNVEGFIRIYCNHRQDDWDELLPFAEFTYNNSIHSSIGMSPFMASRGYNPTFTNMPSAAQSNPAAEERLTQLEELQKEIRSSMAIAQEKQKEFADRHREKEPEYKVGDKVWLSAQNITTDRPTKKFAAKRLGPYKVIAKVSSHAYKLDLPHTMPIHPVFHVSLLTPHTTDTIPGRTQPELPPVIVEDHEEFEVEKIVNSRKHYGKVQYLVKWKGYGPEGNTWEPPEHMTHAKEKIDEFYQRFPKAFGAPPQRQSSRRQP